MENSNYKHCDKDGCNQSALACYLWDDDDDKPSYHYCATHAEEEGFCYSCGNFSAGMESFDIVHPGLCDNCYDSIRSSDIDDFSEYENEYEEE